MVTFFEAIKKQEYFEDFITRSTYHSNSIEGNTLSYGETYALIFNQEDFKINANPREIYEAINHKYAIDYILKHVDEDLTERMIIDIAVRINRNIDEIDGYRKAPVYIRGAEHIPPAPSEVKQAMMYLVYNTTHTEYESIYEKCAEFHVQFERIHPFSDGNGRTGRLLVNYLLLKNGNLPIVIPKDRRSEYFEMLAAIDVKGMATFFEQLHNEEKSRIHQFFPCKKQTRKIEGR